MSSAFRTDYFLKTRARLLLVQFRTCLWCSFLSIIFMVWLPFGLLASCRLTRLTEVSGSRLSRRGCSSPLFQSLRTWRNRAYFPR